MDPIKLFYIIFRPAPKQTTLFVQEFAVQPNDDMIHHKDSPQVPYLSTYPHPLAANNGMSLKSDVVVAWLVVESTHQGSGTLVGHSHDHHLLLVCWICWMLGLNILPQVLRIMPEPRSSDKLCHRKAPLHNVGSSFSPQISSGSHIFGKASHESWMVHWCIFMAAKLELVEIQRFRQIQGP